MNLKEVLKHVNMTSIAKESGISYDIIRNYKTGRTQELKDYQLDAILEAIEKLTTVKVGR